MAFYDCRLTDGADIYADTLSELFQNFSTCLTHTCRLTTFWWFEGDRDSEVSGIRLSLFICLNESLCDYHNCVARNL
jgi:hypothetical protein